MKTIATERTVDASPGTVWAVLTDLAAYPDWNPHVTTADVALHEGGEGRITVRPTGGSERKFDVTVTDFVPERELAWVATVGSRWLFRGRHAFELEPLDDGRTRFVNREDLSGLLPRLLVRGDAREGYEAMNDALAARAEAMTHPDALTAE